tara:strand:- start:1551 stop:2045 length:495 start_codon:yes stop_codon:yes gene_type:complete
MIKVFKELKSLANKGVYNKTSIEYWLHKNKLKYKNLKSDIDALERDFPNAYIRNDDRLINEVKFLETYEVLIDVLECYKNELYFKAEIEYYNRIKNDEVELKSWLKMHKLDEVKMQSKFRELFQNTSTFSGYEFIIRYPFDLPVKLEVNTSDFQNTIQFIEILK